MALLLGWDRAERKTIVFLLLRKFTTSPALLPRHRNTLLPWHLLALLARHTCALLSWHTGALLPGLLGALLPGHRLALLPRHGLALLPTAGAAVLLGHSLAHLVWHLEEEVRSLDRGMSYLSADIPLYGLAALPSLRPAGRRATLASVGWLAGSWHLVGGRGGCGRGQVGWGQGVWVKGCLGVWVGCGRMLCSEQGNISKGLEEEVTSMQ